MSLPASKREGQIVRPAVPEDAPALGRIHTAAWREAYKGMVSAAYLARLSPEKRGEGFRQAILKGGEDEIWCAERDGGLAGFVTFGPCRDDGQDAVRIGEIYAIYLDPVCWRQGLGTALCRRAEERLRERGFEQVVLWVLEQNSGSRAFYEAMGYALDGAIKELAYGEATLTAIRYRKARGVPQ
jgi:ribosomal protein S18 acetylase RimI-like enzyme